MKLGNNFYKLKENLFLRGNTIISYETEVAHIEDGKIVEGGKYSRTTSKHIAFVSRILGLPVVSNTQKKNNFWKHEMGIKCSYDNFISPKSSLKIIKSIVEGFPYEVALAMLKRDLSKKDWELLEGKELISERLQKGANILNRLKL